MKKRASTRSKRGGNRKRELASGLHLKMYGALAESKSVSTDVRQDAVSNCLGRRSRTHALRKPRPCALKQARQESICSGVRRPSGVPPGNGRCQPDFSNENS